MKKEILHYGNRMSNNILTTPTHPVEYIDKKLHAHIQSMHDVLDHSKDFAVGLASNQINGDYRIFVYRDDNHKLHTVINPYIVEEDRLCSEIEGCLSFPNTWTIVPRYRDIIVEYVDFLSGDSRKESFSGFLARLFQHEIDHLEGILFIDYLDKEEQDEFLARYARNNRSTKGFRR